MWAEDDVANRRSVALFGIRFPRLTRDEAIELVTARVVGGQRTGVAFPDMSTLNIAIADERFRRLLSERMLVLNDGAGLALAAWLRRQPFPANLNGTDLTGPLLSALPSATTVYVLGARPGRAERAARRLREQHQNLVVVGHHHGYLDPLSEQQVVDELAEVQPQVVLVGMGNPRQIEFIDRHLDHPALDRVVWLAVGGLLDYLSGELVRAPAWAIRGRIEWLYIVARQPHKWRRYFLGVPKYFIRVLYAQVRGLHDVPEMT
jgi:exopolysaccharide biosynthesis WecB/TagA/CpsF family protein